MALAAARAGGVSAALFAPGWVYEEFDRSTFEPRQEGFWGKVGRPDGSPYTNVHLSKSASASASASSLSLKPQPHGIQSLIQDHSEPVPAGPRATGP